MEARRIAFIGGGNMATALIHGVVEGMEAQAASATPRDLTVVVSDPSPERRAALIDRYGIEAVGDNMQAIAQADIVVLAVKPQQIRMVAEQIRSGLAAEQLVVSVAAGITSAALSAWLGGHPAIVRAMPNTPAMVGCGATGLYADASLSERARSNAESLLRSVGVVQWVAQEGDLDKVTALSGSGPAYVFLVMEAMQAAAEKLGLGADAARLLTLETVYGAARLAMTADESPAELRARVTSPGGTTEQGIAALERAGLREAFVDALRAAHDRSEELGRSLSQGD